jgi:Fe-S-cluster containining protein
VTHDAVPAGDFSPWLAGMRAAIRGERASDVPCGSCTGCCTSSQFIHIGPDETDTLAHLPAELLFTAPGWPAGHVLMGYDERGHCPMLIDGACSVYAHRPRTCRTYDCRVFPAAGIEVDEPAKAAIRERTQRWRFDHPTPTDRVEHAAVLAAATYLEAGPGVLPDASAPRTATARAVVAVEIHRAFLRRDERTGTMEVVEQPDDDMVRDEFRGSGRT